jgi:hypothetical protein
MDVGSHNEGIEIMTGAARKTRLARRSIEALRERMQRSLYTEVCDVALERGVREPAGFLAEIMAGNDPRDQYNAVVRIIENVRARGIDAMPTESEWYTLADLIMCNPNRTAFIPIETSVKAAEKLLPYLYETRKSAPVAADPVNSSAALAPLTAEEIELFEAHWNECY